MFIIKYITDTIVPDTEVVLRTSEDAWMGRGGEYMDASWQFILDEEAFPGTFEFKFAIPPNRWMDGPNITINRPVDGDVFVYTDETVHFPDFAGLVVENGIVAQTLLKRDLGNIHYDVIVVGSGMGGGILASALADRGKNVLVLEAGPLLFPTHVGNLPRRLLIGKFDKHIWSLWEKFKVVNYTQGQGSHYHGAQGFNLGGRSLFWGSLIPSLSPWELNAWPPAVKNYLTSPQGSTGYDKAKRVFNADIPALSPFQREARIILTRIRKLQDWDPQPSPVAVEYIGATNLSIPAGIFSAADLLLEDVLAQEPPVLTPTGRNPLTVNLNHAVHRVTKDQRDPTIITGVQCYDLLAQKERIYQADKVVLCAGTIESAKIALQSNLADPNRKIGKGITDHTIMYRHFTIPSAYWNRRGVASPGGESAKFLITHPAAADDLHSFDIVLELGSQFNQGRYVDPDHLAQDQAIPGGMLCEIVFQFYAPLMDSNTVETVGTDPVNPVRVFMAAVEPPNNMINEAKTIAQAVFVEFGAMSIENEPPLTVGGTANLITAPLGGVAHEVGTLRMAENNRGVVDEHLRFLHYRNLYACDNSVFPVSPCGNPSLTLAALALRLAKGL
ncbi:hypothetical protein BDW59DRAFT_165854 [Aspergillus cavernicola]|uniref:GMC family oxidoreductase n=1 Tax=Aspergillus cavernicola TaxID=176166 RepID=A0ABR4HQD8_9EURO